MEAARAGGLRACPEPEPAVRMKGVETRRWRLIMPACVSGLRLSTAGRVDLDLVARYHRSTVHPHIHPRSSHENENESEIENELTTMDRVSAPPGYSDMQPEQAPPSAQAGRALSSTSAPSQPQPSSSTSASTSQPQPPASTFTASTSTASPSAPPAVTGSCLCTAVRFRITPPLPPIQVCHCTQCRKAQGATLATNIPIASSSLVLSGADSIREYESSAGKFRAFCCLCGSPIYSRRADLEGVYRIRAGLLDEPLPVQVEVGLHQWVGSGAGWWSKPREGEGEEVYVGAKPEGRSRG